MVEILVNSRYASIAIIVVIVLTIIKIIRVVWKIIKENKVITSAIENKDVCELTIDKKGSIFVRKKSKK